MAAKVNRHMDTDAKLWIAGRLTCNGKCGAARNKPQGLSFTQLNRSCDSDVDMLGTCTPHVNSKTNAITKIYSVSTTLNPSQSSTKYVQAYGFSGSLLTSLPQPQILWGVVIL
jgi:hypothetical protein